MAEQARIEWGIVQDGPDGSRVFRGPASPDVPRSFYDLMVNARAQS